MRNIALLFAAALLASCSSHRSEELTAAERNAIREAQNVVPENYRADVIAYMRNYLNDPTGVRSAAISQPQLRELPGGARYASCMRYDAKKTGSQQYAGLKTVLIVFISGRLDRVIEPPLSREPREVGEAVQIREACKDAVFMPFPELQAMRR
jgi:hypothetical protein